MIESKIKIYWFGSGKSYTIAKITDNDLKQYNLKL